MSVVLKAITLLYSPPSPGAEQYRGTSQLGDNKGQNTTLWRTASRPGPIGKYLDDRTGHQGPIGTTTRPPNWGGSREKSQCGHTG